MDSLLTTVKSFDLLSIFWILSSFLIGVTHIIFSLGLASEISLVQYLTDLTKTLYYFGKLKHTHLKRDSISKQVASSRWVSTLSSVPKRYFGHFYLVGIVIHSFFFLILVLYLNLIIPLPGALRDIASHIHWYGPSVKGQLGPARSAVPVLSVFACQELHLVQRLYECFFISSFSRGTISVIHYFYGMAFYTLFSIGVLVSIPLQHLSLSVSPTPMEVICCTVGTMMFLVFAYLQHKTMRTFSDLRIKERDTSARSHYIPRGHLFQWVSSPHYLCEILLYLALCVTVQCRSVYLACSTLFVLVNQTCAGLSVHLWYMQTFPNYPRDRKAIVPYVL